MAFVILAACDADPTPTSTPILQATPTTGAIAQLYDAAKAEGKLAIMSFDSTYADLASGPFTERFPGIVVEAQLANTPEMTARIAAQAESGVYETDLVQGSAGSVLALADRGLIAGPSEVDWASLGYAQELLLVDGHLPVQWDFVYAHGYNTELVDPADLPQTLEGFTDPKWSGKVIASPFLYPSGMAFVALRQGEEATVTLAKRIFDADLVLSDSAESLLGSGEASLMVHVSINRMIKDRLSGAPVDYFFTPVAGAARIGLAMVKEAQNPSAAKLFNYWLATPEGKAALFEASAQALVAGLGEDNEIIRRVAESGADIVLESDANGRERSRLTAVMREAVLGQ
jgi:ABC-type Fe3+ transport system substrate-binding protein